MEITNALQMPTGIPSHRSKVTSQRTMPVVKVGVDYRDLAHRKIPSARPRTSPIYRTSNSEKRPKAKESGLQISGIASQFHDEYNRSIVSEKPSKMKNKLVNMCYGIEGSLSIENCSFEIGEKAFQDQSGILDDVEQHQPFSPQPEIVDLQADVIPPPDIASSVEIAIETSEVPRPVSPSDPGKFFFDMWLTKHFPDNPQIKQTEKENELQTFHLELICRLQNAFSKARYLNSISGKKRKKETLQTEKKSDDNSSIGSENDANKLSLSQIECLKLIADASLDVLDSLINEKGDEFVELSAIRDALLPLLFDTMRFSNFSHDAMDPSNITRMENQSLYSSFSTFLEKCYHLEDANSSLTSKYETLMKNYLNLEITNSELTKLNSKFESKLFKFKDKNKTLTESLQSLHEMHEKAVHSIKELETKYVKAKESSFEFEKNYSVLKQVCQDIKSQNLYLTKANKELENKSLFLLKEQDKLIRENEVLQKIKMESKKSLDEVQNSYARLLDSFHVVCDSVSSKFSKLIPSYDSILHGEVWMKGLDNEEKELNYNSDYSIQKALPNPATVSSNTGPHVRSGFENPKSLSSSFINPHIAKSKSSFSVTKDIDEKIICEVEKVSVFSNESEYFTQQFEVFLLSLQLKHQECQSLQKKYDHKLTVLNQDMFKLVQLHQETMISQKNQFLEDQLKSELSQKAITENQRMLLTEKEIEIATLIEVRNNQAKQVNNLMEELSQKTIHSDYLRKEQLQLYNRFEMVKNDKFWQNQELKLLKEIKLKNLQIGKINNQLEESQKELHCKFFSTAFTFYL
jgi:hypothetical protein